MIAAAVDVVLGESAKRHRWARVIRAVLGLSLVAAIVAVVAITVAYS